MKKKSMVAWILVLAMVCTNVDFVRAEDVSENNAAQSALAVDAEAVDTIETDGEDVNADIPAMDTAVEENIASGTWREMNWVIDGNGTLTISGKNYGAENAQSPVWLDYKSSIKSVIVTAESVKSTYCWFDGCVNLTNLDISSFDTSSVKDMRCMFRDCSSLTSLDVSNFDTSSVKDMRMMFYGCRSLTSLDVSNFDTSSVKDIGSMFDGCRSLTSLDLSNFDTSSVANMDGMFWDCSSLASLDLSNFDTSSVTNMKWMFHGCSSLTSLDLSNFDTSSVTNMEGMFSFCSSLASLDLSNFDTSSVANMRWMFFDCSSLASLDVSNFDTSSVTNMEGMFYGCRSLKQIRFFKNIMQNLVLPVSPMYDAVGNVYVDYFPTDLSESIWLYAEKPESIPEGQFRVYVKDAVTGEPISDAYVFVDNIEYPTTDMGYLDLNATPEDTSIHTIYASAEGYMQRPYQQLQIKDGESYTFYLDRLSSDDPEEEDPSQDDLDFNPDIYHASYDYDEHASIIEKAIFGDTPSSRIYYSAKQTGLVNSAQAWRDFQDTLSMIDDPSKVLDMPCKKQDIYEGIIFNLFEASSDSGWSSKSMKEVKSFISVVKENVKAQNIISEFESHDLSKMSFDEKYNLAKATQKAFGEEWKGSVQPEEMQTVFDVIKYIDDYDEYLEYIVNCYSLREMSDSYKAILKDMYINCPEDNLELQAALLDCIASIELSDEALMAKMQLHELSVAGKRATQESLKIMWKEVKTKAIAKNPYVALFWVSYNTSNYLTKAAFNSDAIAEKTVKLCAMMDIRELMISSYKQEKKNFSANRNEGNASKYLAAIDIGYNYLNEDCEAAYGFADSVSDSLVSQIEEIFGEKTYEDTKKAIKQYQNNYFDMHEQEKIAWLNGLEEDAPELYEKYKYLRAESEIRLKKHYHIACPVDVYVYDQAGELVASVAGRTPYCKEDELITVTVTEDEKDLFFYGDAKQYTIKYVGTDAGTMDISVEEYGSEQTITREVEHTDVPLISGKTYISTENLEEDDKYILEVIGEADEKRSPVIDTRDESLKQYTLTIHGGYMADEQKRGSTAQCYAGEKVTVYATVYDGDSFKSWCSDAVENIFADKSMQVTEITMPMHDLEITALTDKTLPVGKIENIRGESGEIYITGWSYDPDDSSKCLNLYAYIGGEAGSTEAEKYVLGATDISRADINEKYGITGTHGFAKKIVTDKQGELIIYVYALDESSGKEQYIGHKVVTLDKPVEESNEWGIYFSQDPSDDQTVTYNEATKRYEHVYTGSKITPTVVVMNNGKQLKAGVDYTISYSNNINAFKQNAPKPANVTVAGKGNFSGKYVAEFYITPKSLNNENTVWADDTQAEASHMTTPAEGIVLGGMVVADGSKLVPTITYRGKKLTVKDYTITSSTGKLTFTASDVAPTVTITGKGNYVGEIKNIPVNVVSKADHKKTAIKVTLEKGVVKEYNRSAQRLTVSTADAAGNMTAGELRVISATTGDLLVEGTDFQLQYMNNINAGTAKVVITGIGAYSGVQTKTFKITPDRSTASVTAALADSRGEFPYSKAGVCPKIVVTEVRDNVQAILKEGVDYKISYTNNKRISTEKNPAKYTVHFIGNYKGRADIKNQTFAVTQAAFSDAEITLADMIYRKPGKYFSVPYVTVGNIQLSKSDYDVTYWYNGENITGQQLQISDDVDAAVITVRVTGKGNYSSAVVEGTYTVTKLSAETLDLTKAKIVAKGTMKSIGAQSYTGKAVRPDIEVYVKNGKTWEKVDAAFYQLTYVNNVERGKATIIVTGNGTEAKGSRTTSFRIGARSLRDLLQLFLRQ